MTLSVDSICISRAGRRILSDVSCVVDPGHALILRGPNGIGKTTLLRCLAGFVPADHGRARFQDAATDAADGLQDHVAFAGHSDGIKGQLTVRENLRFWQALCRAQSADPAIAAFGLADILDRDAHACSAGQKRRLGLARLVLSGRAIWLLDEPSVSLDSAAKLALSRAITTHLDRGGIALISTHEADLVADATTLDLAPFAAKHAPDPFLDEAFS